MEKCPPGFVLRSIVDGSGGLTCQCDYGDGNILACSLKDRSVDLKVTYMVTFLSYQFSQDGLFAVDRLNTLFFNLKILPCPPTYCQCQRVDNSTLCIARYHHMNEELQCHPERTGIWKLCFYIICMYMTKEI